MVDVVAPAVVTGRGWVVVVAGTSEAEVQAASSTNRITIRFDISVIIGKRGRLPSRLVSPRLLDSGTRRRTGRIGSRRGRTGPSLLRPPAVPSERACGPYPALWTLMPILRLPKGESWVSAGLDGSAHNARRALGSGRHARSRQGLERSHSDGDAGRTVAPGDRPDVDAAGVVLAVGAGYWPNFAREVDPDLVSASVAVAAAEGRGWVKLIGDWPRKGQGPVANFSERQLRRRGGSGCRPRSPRRDPHHGPGGPVDGGAGRGGLDRARHVPRLRAISGLLATRQGMWVPTVLQMEAVIRQLGAESSGGRLLREGLENVAASSARRSRPECTSSPAPTSRSGHRQVAAEAIRLWEMGLARRLKWSRRCRPRACVANGRSGGFEVGAAGQCRLLRRRPDDRPPGAPPPGSVVRLGRVVG